MTPATAADSIPRPEGIPRNDRELLVRLTIVIVLGFLFVAAFVRLDLVYSRKFFDVSGPARWIWPNVDISQELPVTFFATRDFDLPANRYYTKIKVAGDPQYTLYFNGREIAGRRLNGESALDVYDVTQLAKTGRNRIVIAVRATQGVGGLLAAVDISPETENYIVTDTSWKVATSWRPDLISRDVPGMRRPRVIGTPPIGRWNYLKPQPAALEVPPSETAQPVGSWYFRGALPEVQVIEGVAVRGSKYTRAWAYDFGKIMSGRIRLTRSTMIGGDVIDVRLTGTKEQLLPVEGDLHSFCFAPGERTVTDPEVHPFRYVAIYERPATPEALINK
ncbi:MAG TPA: hypothetical protein VHU41_07810 [Thermoanaerobaculia bacterium]|nr:hypothetical protein [Thermoanaerobaculia bacterium]